MVTTGAAPAIEIRALNIVRSKNHILHDVTVTIPRGGIVGLLGPSGCGKTTLMRTVVGVQKITSGDAVVLGESPGSRSLRGRVGYVTQEAAVYSDLTVRQNVAYFASLYGVPSGAIAETVEKVGLTAHMNRAVHKLSGGETGRVSLACALVGNPDLLVLDEPTVGLDPLTREDLWNTFHALAQSGHTLVVSSHVMDEATRCDSLILMRQGRVLAHLTPTELLESTGTSSPDDAFLHLIREGGK